VSLKTDVIPDYRLKKWSISMSDHQFEMTLRAILESVKGNEVRRRLIRYTLEMIKCKKIISVTHVLTADRLVSRQIS
jgi:hypothetical protein